MAIGIRARVGQTAPAQAQLAARGGQRGHGQHHGLIQGGHFNVHTQGGFPWGESQIEIQVMVVGAEHCMRQEADVQVNVAIGPARMAFAAFAA